jgi:hypothetical protein
MVIPVEQQICADGQTGCNSEIRQQFAVQRMGTVDCGDIVLWNSPACGQVPLLQSSDVRAQGRWDKATMRFLDDIDGTCNAAGDITIFGFYPKVVQQGGGMTTTCAQPVKMRRLRFKASQWGTVLGASDAASKAMIMTAKNAGGDPTDPCMELQMTDISLSKLAALVNGAVQPWIPHTQQILANAPAGTFPVALTGFPTTGTVYGVFASSIGNVISGGVSIIVTATNQTLQFCRETTTSANEGYGYSVALLPSPVMSFSVVKTGATAATSNLTLIGYLVSP